VSAKKNSTTEGGVAVVGRKSGSKSGRRYWIAAGIVAALIGGACYAVWNHVSRHVLADAQYQVHPEHINVTPLPPWIRGDIKAEIIRDASRAAPLSLLDDDLTVRLAGAFAAHPWIARVDRVSKHFPSGVDVVVAYRVPVAMVEVQDGQAVLPVDVEGVVLPTREASGKQNFTPEEAERFPRIAEIHTMPAGPVGTHWGDAAVLGGAQIAAAIAQDWEKLKLARIIPWERKPARSGVEYTYALVTHSGTTVHWGRAPGTEMTGETPAAVKVSQLKTYLAQNGGTLDGPDGPQEIEIGTGGGLFRKARPTVTPLPPGQQTGETSPAEADRSNDSARREVPD
jgi:hypothetical protein